jgi:hypothetical protein
MAEPRFRAKMPIAHTPGLVLGVGESEAAVAKRSKWGHKDGAFTSQPACSRSLSTGLLSLACFEACGLGHCMHCGPSLTRCKQIKKATLKDYYGNHHGYVSRSQIRFPPKRICLCLQVGERRLALSLAPQRHVPGMCQVNYPGGPTRNKCGTMEFGH